MQTACASITQFHALLAIGTEIGAMGFVAVIALLLWRAEKSQRHPCSAGPNTFQPSKQNSTKINSELPIGP